jgi:hypothetical protein
MLSKMLVTSARRQKRHAPTATFPLAKAPDITSFEVHERDLGEELHQQSDQAVIKVTRAWLV